ncbi:ceramide glucosyltransferase, partial [Phenoliferia sp. Uapishka_3]
MIGTCFVWLGLAWYALMWSLGVIGLCVARKRYGKTASRALSFPPPPGQQLPGVSILRPLRGLDCNLYENLEASFLQEYSGPFEIIFSVAEEGDLAIPIVHELMRKYPHILAQLIVGEEIVGVNPKINNLIRPYRAAQHDILWVLDSNVLTSTKTLRNSVHHLTSPPLPGHRPIGLVHHLPFAIYPDDNLGSRVEQVFLCSTHAKMYLAINWVAVASCVTGKSCLYRRSDLERAAEKKRQGGKGLILADGEGLAAFGQYLGEDNMIGQSIWEDLGMRHAMGSDVAGNAVGSMTFRTFFQRRVRWIRVRKYMVTVSTLIEPITECFLCGLVGAAVLSRFFSLSPFLTYPLHVILWFTFDCLIFANITYSSPSPSRHGPPRHDGPGLDYLKAWLVRESMALPIWIFAMIGSEVGWRDNGQTYRVQMDGSVRLSESVGNALPERMLKALRIGERENYVRLSPDEENH